MAMINPCSVAATSSNTGAECKTALRATAMLILMDKTTKWTATNELTFTTYIDTMIHAPAATRWYPIFGNNAPIRQITESNESDVLETLEDGSVQFIRFGMYNRMFITTEGGLCLARNLSAVNRNLGFIEVDIDGQVQRMTNADGTFSPFPVNLAYSPVPELANLKTSYKNKFYLSFSKKSYIDKGAIVGSDSTEDILSLRGLYDTKVTQGVTAATTTLLYVNVNTICGNTDLIALYPTALPVATNFIITKVSDGSTQVASAVAVSAGQVRLTGTYVSAATYTVALAAPSVLKAALIEGYEGIVKASILIP